MEEVFPVLAGVVVGLALHPLKSRVLRRWPSPPSSPRCSSPPGAAARFARAARFPTPPRMRILAWNIRAGGGVRVPAIARQLGRWAPDVVALSEFRATPPSGLLRAALAEAGLVHQLTTADPRRPALNALLVAARWPLTRVRLGGAPAVRARWLLASIAAPLPLVVGALHVPNRVSGLKYPFLDAVLTCARSWRRGPALIVGDTNSGRRGLDEQVPAFNAREE